VFPEEEKDEEGESEEDKVEGEARDVEEEEEEEEEESGGKGKEKRFMKPQEKGSELATHVWPRPWTVQSVTLSAGLWHWAEVQFQLPLTRDTVMASALHPLRVLQALKVSGTLFAVTTEPTLTVPLYMTAVSAVPCQCSTGTLLPGVHVK
jgi:hypothetical protein